MQITEISYGLTINLGNYESARIDMTASVGDENVEAALADLKAVVQLEAARLRQEVKRGAK